MPDWIQEHTIITQSADGRERLIALSYARVTGSELLRAGSDPADALWTLPAVVVAHGAEADPVFFYGNRAALELFELPAAEFVRLPSRLSAEVGDRAGRARLMEQVARDNFVRGYSGVRVSGTGRRFRIEGATVWNLLDADGVLHGQAAAFDSWTLLG